jgi:hypothetical protein
LREFEPEKDKARERFYRDLEKLGIRVSRFPRIENARPSPAIPREYLTADGTNRDRRNERAEETGKLEIKPAGQPQNARTQHEKPYRIGDNVHLDDGMEYRIERIEADSVTARQLGLDSGFIIAFRDLYTDDFEKQLRGNLFNQEILNRAKTAMPAAESIAATDITAKSVTKSEEISASPETIGQNPVLQSFYDAFGQDAKLARDLHEAIQNAAQADFRENIIKQRRIKAAIFQVFQTHAVENSTDCTEFAFDIFLEKSESQTLTPVSENTAETITPAAITDTMTSEARHEAENKTREDAASDIPGERRDVKQGAAAVLLAAAMKSFENVSADETRSREDRAESISGNVEDLRGRGFAFPEEDAARIEEMLRELQRDIPPKIDFRITDDNLGHGGQKAKYRNNVEAIQTLRKIESENRLATPEEQEVLSRYVSWGAVSQAFDSQNQQWAAEYAELKELLTDEEYKAARATTINAFYTSPTVIKAMYEALGNMGFTKGNILEPSCG